MAAPPTVPSPGRRLRFAMALGALCAGLTLGAAPGGPLSAQSAEGVPVSVDAEGVLRWTDGGGEVALFGVNYSVPFAHAYRALGTLGIDPVEAMEADVAHLDRLGVEAFRVHVWDRQVSDRWGNLVENDHLDLLDRLIALLAERGIRTLLTPIAWWPPGYPEPNPDTDGLSDGWDKGGMTTDPAAVEPTRNYLRQFITHVNPYRGMSYRDDPFVIAVEIFNEPDHPGTPEQTTGYIDTMAEALRQTGFRKPIFYNISQGYRDSHGHAVCAADIQGVSHQWYPTGLVRNRAVPGDMLPNVSRYTIPYADFPECGDKARMVYEFDAADVAGSYMYPAMARSFRGAGFQWATQFAYDPLAFAWANTEYQTHFLNLVYTPGKAVSFFIAGEAFRRIPRGAAFGGFPESNRFGQFRVSYREDLSELVGDTVFAHSNDTRTAPPAPGALRRIVGVGSSRVADYDGTGAYFLDRLGDGAWRLEVYPDAVSVVDPYTRPGLGREAVRLAWRSRGMTLRLPGLGPDFTVHPLDAGNPHRPSVEAGRFEVRPGAYLLAARGVDASSWTGETEVGGVPLGRFVAPEASSGPTVVLHDPPTDLPAGQSFEVRLEVVSNVVPDSVRLNANPPGGGFAPPLHMEAEGGFRYGARIPAERLETGELSYTVTVWIGDESRTFPADAPGHPRRWDYTGRETWRVPVVGAEVPVVLFDGVRDRDRILYPHPWEYVPFRTSLGPGSAPDRLALTGVVEDLDPEPGHLALRTVLPATARHRLSVVGADPLVRIRARGAMDGPDRVEVALVERDGTAWATVLDLSDAWVDHEVSLSEFRRVPLALLPRPYPQFLPYLLDAETDTEAAGPGAAELDGVQFAVHRGLFPEGSPSERGFQVERITLVPRMGGGGP